MSLKRPEEDNCAILFRQQNRRNVSAKIVEHISLQLLLNAPANPFFETNKSLILTCMYLFISMCDQETFSALVAPETAWGSHLTWLFQFMKREPNGGGKNDAYLPLLVLLLCVSQVTQAIYLTTNKNVDATVQLFLTNSGVFAAFNYVGTCGLNALANMFGNLEAVEYAKDALSKKYQRKIEQIVSITANESLGLVAKSYVDDYMLENSLAKMGPTGDLLFEFSADVDVIDNYSLIDDYETFEEALLLAMAATERRMPPRLPCRPFQICQPCSLRATQKQPDNTMNISKPPTPN